MATPTPYDVVTKAVFATMQECSGQDENGACYSTVLHNTDAGVILYSNDHRACQSRSDILLPGFELLPRGLLVVIYMLMLVWVFMGVNLIADQFTAAIEVITSTTKKVKVKHPVTGEEVEVEKPVWNWVVANITLMALGTSAPEITLATLEAVLTLGSTPGELGPACVVGSSAYNFFVINAVCTVALAYGTVKEIKEVRVYVCTAAFSVWAHLFMYICYSIVTPGVIDLWEAFVMLGQFPILVYTAYLVDTQPWKKQTSVFTVQVHPANGDGKTLSGNPELGFKVDAAKRHSVLHYRQMMMRKRAGEANIEAGSASGAFSSQRFSTGSLNLKRSASGGGSGAPLVLPHGAVRVCFSSVHYSVLESQGVARVLVLRSGGDVSGKCTVKYRSVDGTAVAGIDYEPIEGFLTFQPGEKERSLEIKIVDDDMAEPDVTLSVQLSDVTGDNHYITQAAAHVTIVDDDDGGMLAFELPTFEVGCNDDHALVTVVRRHGVSGDVSVEWATKDGTAVAGTHYQGVGGVLDLPKGESRAYLRVPILMPDAKDSEQDGNPVFKLVLSNPSGGAVLGQRTECRVIITAASKQLLSPRNEGTQLALAHGGGGNGGGDEEGEEEFELWSAWVNQFREAIMPEIDRDDWGELIMHYCSITWKLLIALVPPPEWKSGYPCFAAVMPILIGIVYIMKEAAELFGCSVGLSDLMTGISLVALGTSLPDTLASRWAALKEDTADAAVGNITGSNSVNIFLGLGLPWVISAVYYAAKGETYHVEQGVLGFSLVLFCTMLVGAQAVLIYARITQGGELGGSKQWQWTMFSILMTLYFLFLILVGLLDHGHITSKI